MATSAPPRVLNLVATALVLLPVLAAAAGPGRASSSCPWINEATSSGLLGGDAAGSFSAASGGRPAVCTFTRHEEGVTRTLNVTVEIASDPHARVVSVAGSCRADPAPLRAIGNEAVHCATRRSGPGERAVGRVRDQVFTITIESSRKDDPVLTPMDLKNRIYTAAEQVAGNLY